MADQPKNYDFDLKNVISELSSFGLFCIMLNINHSVSKDFSIFRSQIETTVNTSTGRS